MKARGVMSFADYMQLVLYHPEYGYYQRSVLPMGAKGDFLTAPEISPLFADCLATECANVFSSLDSQECIEYGAGSGQLAIDLINALRQQGIHIKRYIIIEVSQSLREKQRERIQAALQDDSKFVIWLDAAPLDFCGVVIANEVLDAIPCHTFSVQDGEFFERAVGFSSDQLTFVNVPLFSPGLKEALASLQKELTFPVTYASEINLHVNDFIKQLLKPLKKAVVFLIDYGYGQKEYYHPERVNGTLTCFHQHHYHDDPFKLPGLQDITAHVDFTRVADCALEMGASVLGFTTQAHFLLSLGLMEHAKRREEQLSAVEQFQLHDAIKRLTFPTEMGETIKIMALAKGCDAHDVRLAGFRLKDRRQEL